MSPAVLLDVSILIDALVAAGVISAAAGAVWARAFFAQKATEKVRKNTRASINKFIQENRNTQNLKDEFRLAAEELLDVIHSSRAMRAAIMARMQNMKIPNAENPMSMENLKMELGKLGDNLLWTISGVYVHKFTKLISDQVQYRMDVAHGFHHIAPHLSGFEQKIVDGLDHAGIIDLAQKGADGFYHAITKTAHQVKAAAADHASSVGDGLSQAASDAAADHGAAAADAFTHSAADSMANHATDFMTGAMEIMSIPGFISGARSAFREFDLLINDNTTFGESMRYGFVPVAVRSSVIAVGIAIDSMFGWATMGVFTLAASVLSSLGNTQYLVEAIKEQIELLKQHMLIIEERRRLALERINDVVARFMLRFKAKIEECPKIEDQTSLKNFLKHLHQAYLKGMQATVDAVTRNAEAEIRKQQDATRKEKLRGVYSGEEISRMYREAARQVQSEAAGLVHEFSMALEKNPEDAVRFIIQQPAFMNEETLAAFKSMKRVATRIRDNYSRLLTAWENECMDVWKEGNEEIADVTDREHKETKRVVDEQNALMKPIRRRIYALKRRLGQKEAAPA